MTHAEDGASLTLDPELRDRLATLAERAGLSLHDLAETVLRAHADAEERVSDELAEDEARWQRYLADGQAIPFETVRERLRTLAAEAARRDPPR